MSKNFSNFPCKFSFWKAMQLIYLCILFQASGVAQNSTKKSGSTELNLNLGLEDPDDDSDADLSAEEQRDSGSNQRSDNRLKRKAF
jgi:hypothetical protein